MVPINIGQVQTATITAASASAATLKLPIRYQVVADTACYISHGAAAIGGATSQYLPANTIIEIDPSSTTLNVIGTAGKISVTPIAE